MNIMTDNDSFRLGIDIVYHPNQSRIVGGCLPKCNLPNRLLHLGTDFSDHWQNSSVSSNFLLFGYWQSTLNRPISCETRSPYLRSILFNLRFRRALLQVV